MIRKCFKPGAVLAALSMTLTLFSAEKKIDPETMPAADFLRIVRHAPSQESWAKMSGTAMHKRDDARRIKSPIALSIRFTPERILAQLHFDGKERFDLSQTFEPPVSVVDSSLKKGEKSRLALYGIDIRDLTMNFMYQDMIREEKPERVSMFPCRVFLLKGAVKGETARLFISTAYFFPVKVQWFTGDPGEKKDLKPYRELEVASVKKAENNDFYLIPKLEISGPDWRTRIDFDDRSAGYVKDGIPEDLFQD